MYVFQSNGRTQDVQIKVGGVNKVAQFANWRYSTPDDETAAAVRKNCNPLCGIVDLTPPDALPVIATNTEQKAVRGARLSQVEDK